eukprot:9498141-Pyramimonas_sp.AAC.1
MYRMPNIRVARYLVHPRRCNLRRANASQRMERPRSGHGRPLGESQETTASARRGHEAARAVTRRNFGNASHFRTSELRDQ